MKLKLAGWLAGCLAGWLTSWLAGWLAENEMMRHLPRAEEADATPSVKQNTASGRAKACSVSFLNVWSPNLCSRSCLYNKCWHVKAYAARSLPLSDFSFHPSLCLPGPFFQETIWEFVANVLDRRAFAKEKKKQNEH